jgi:putative peptidoglycan lipid II flippase
MVRHGRGVLTVNALVLGSLSVGFLNNVLIAAIFGLTRRVDAFFAAMMLPNLFMVLCVDYLGKNFLPVLATAKHESEQSAATLTSSVVTIVGLLATCVAVVLALFADRLFKVLLPGFESSEIGFVSRDFAIMAPAIVFMAVNTFHEYVWQYEERFVYVSMSRLALPVANLAGMLLLAPFVGEYCLPLSYLVGHVTVFFMLLRKAPYRYRPRIALRPDLERRVFANSAIVMGTGLIARTKSIIMNYLGSTLGGGAIAALALATKLTEPLERSAFWGLRMMMFSHTARLFVERNERAVAELYKKGIKASFLLLAPLLWWVGLNGEEIVRVLFQRGEFTGEMAGLVAGALVALIPSVLFIGMNQLLSNGFYAMNRVKVPAIVMPFGTAVYVGAAVPLGALLGTQGLALATTVTAAVTFVALFACFARVLPDLRALRTALKVLFYALLAGATMIAATGLLRSLGGSPFVVAALSLPLGAAFHSGVLAASGDETFQMLFRFAQGFWRAGGARTAAAPRQ